MRKEIIGQPGSIERTLNGRLDHRFQTSQLGGLNRDARTLLGIRPIKFLGCGCAYYAGLTGTHVVETLARVSGDAAPAAEFLYRSPVIELDTLYVAVSQCGETLDTVMAIHVFRRRTGVACAAHRTHPQRSSAITPALGKLPSDIEAVLRTEESIGDIAHAHASANNAFFIEPVISYTTTLGSAQKLKKISPIHSRSLPGI